MRLNACISGGHGGQSMRRLAFLCVAACAALFALVALLHHPQSLQAQTVAPTVTRVEITSNAGTDRTYALGETITITVTFSEAVDVGGAPQLKIDMDPADWGTKVVDYASGSGTTSLTFDHEVVHPNYSTQGVAVLANSLALNGGTIRSASSQTEADLSHARRDHDPEHKVNWQLTSTPPTTPATLSHSPTPTVGLVTVSSVPGTSEGYALGETIRVALSFSEPVNVTGTPRLAIDMDPADWGQKWATYEGGSGTSNIHFAHTVVEPNFSTQGIAVLANSLALNGGTIRSASTRVDADLSHTGRDHDPAHKVNWQLSPSPPNRAPVVNTGTQDYRWFVREQNAPRGFLVSKSFAGLFTDPDGDQLTYAASIAGGRAELLDNLAIGSWGRSDLLAAQSLFPREASQRVFIEVDDDDDWKAISPAMADPQIVSVTLTATDPSGLTASISGDFKIDWDSHPDLESVVAGSQAIVATYDLALQTTPAPSTDQFTVNVANEDGTTGTIAVEDVSVSGAVVTLDLASALKSSQTVTLDYEHDAEAPLKRAAVGGDHAPGFTGRAVDMSLLTPPEQPQNFAVTVQRGQLAFSATWDAVEGATSYRLRWRQAGGKFTAANATTVSDTKATITVSGYGQWEVWLQACNANGCAPEVGGSDGEAPVVRLILEQAQDAGGQSQTRSVTSTRNAAAVGDSYTTGWGPAGTESAVEMQSRPIAARQLRGIDSPSIAVGPRSSDALDTTPPQLVRGEIDGDTITFYFNEALDENATGSRFRVTLYFRFGWVNFTAHPSKVEVSGNKVVVHGLSRDGWPGWERAFVGHPVQAYYYKDDRVVPANQRLRDLAGNEISTPHRSPGGYFPATRTIWVRNLTRPPALQSATANLNQLILTFNKTLDRNSVPPESAFTVTVNGSAVSLASTDPVSVSGATVTLILASPLASTDEVTVSYAKPSERPLRGLDGAVDSFSSPTNLVGVAPTATNVELTSDAGSDRVYAKGEIIRVTLTLSKAVYVTGSPRLKLDFRTGDGDEQWASYESGSGTSTLVFAYTAAAGDDSQDGVAVLANSLDLNGGAIVSTTDGDNALLSHTGLPSNSNHRVDATPPTLARGALSGVILTLTFNENLGAAASLSNDQFSVVRTPQGGTEESVSLTGAPVISGVSVTLTLAGAILDTDTNVKVSYTKPTTGQNNRLIDFAGNETASFTSAPNLVRPAPTVSKVEVTSDAAADETYGSGESIQVTLTFSAAVDVDTTDGTPRLKIKLNPTSGERWADYAEGSGTTELVFAYTVAEPDSSTGGISVLTDTLQLNGGTIRSKATQTDASLGNAGLGHDSDHKVDWQKRTAGAPYVTSVAITSDPAGNQTYARGETVQVTATFSEAVNVDETNGVPRLKIRLQYKKRWNYRHPDVVEDRWAVFTGGSGSTTLNFGYTVSESDRATRGVALLRDALELNGGTISSTAATPVNAHLTYEELRHDPGHLVDAIAPSLVGVTVNGSKVSVSFNETLDSDSVPPASAFTVKRTPQGGNEETVSLSGAPTIAGGTVFLTLANAVAATDTGVKVSYAKPTAAGARPLKDAVGNEAASFMDQATDATDTTPPRPVQGDIDGGSVTIYFSESLDESYETYDFPNEYESHFRVWLDYGIFSTVPSKYRLCRGNAGSISFRATPMKVTIDGNRVILTEIGHGYGYQSLRARMDGSDPSVFFRHYTESNAKILRDLAGNVVSDVELTVDNVTQLPYPRIAKVDGNRLTLTFSAPMDKDRVPAASAFTVKVNGSAVSLANHKPVSISDNNVTLTLTSAVASTDTVTVSYEIPESNWLYNVVCEHAPSFTDQAVTNVTP